MNRLNLSETEIELPELQLSDIIIYLSSFEHVNQLPTIDSFQDYIHDNFDDTEAFYAQRFEGFNFTLQDGTECKLIYREYNCILHTFAAKDCHEAGEWIYIVDGELYLCASCLTRLKSAPEILSQYDVFTNEYQDDSGKILLPVNWNDEKIHDWCRKRQQKEDEYAEKRVQRYLARQERERLDADCSNCIYM